MNQSPPFPDKNRIHNVPIENLGMYQITQNQLTQLYLEQKPPCISLYLPTHQRHPENQQDAIRFRNLLQTLGIKIQQLYPDASMEYERSKLQSLSYDIEFWNRRTEGLAILCSPDGMHQFDLHRAVVESVDVADGFNLKPLLLELQAADRYHVLALSRHEARLFEGNRNSLREVSVSHFPSTIDDALGSELTEQHLTVASYGAGAARAGNGGTTPSVHAHGDKTDEVDNDRDRFFRSIDRSILEHHSRPSGLPLMLAALPEYQEPFHAISHNPFLMTIGLTRSPDSLNLGGDVVIVPAEQMPATSGAAAFFRY